MFTDAGGALQCQYHELYSQDSLTYSYQNCAANEYCAAAGIQDTFASQQWKSCVASSTCDPSNQTFSFNFGVYNLTALVHCCNTDGCNSGNVTYPAVQTANSLQCFTCDDFSTSPVCNKTMQCVGVQDRCISWNMMTSDMIKISGCASRNFCEASPELFSLFGIFSYIKSRGFMLPDITLCNPQSPGKPKPGLTGWKSALNELLALVQAAALPCIPL
ncbi:phospholipase A2 inhibitor and Ly6/PLAUR domain-containing protein-like [Plectropomus leopardus]|uniref:phospholipase A2 inhibitor and Ly6/PLAUR domain-containing protein-like n=1 Tax=Plectropomus leopardus TaxID=160734 RepID=UPI001C4B44B1|nr:phospholipase A2 inhibitor and Ly6/PLAUR domain-containing protein-like [Plectropomus leopardus]